MVLSLLCTFVAHITFLHVFFLPPLSFSLSLLLSLSLSLSLFLSLSLYLCPLFLSVVARHMSSDALYQIFSSWSILLFHTISFHSSYKIRQLFTDYLLRLPSSELLEKHLFRSRANRRLVNSWWFQAIPKLFSTEITILFSIVGHAKSLWHHMTPPRFQHPMLGIIPSPRKGPRIMSVLGVTGARALGQRQPASDSPVGFNPLIFWQSQVGKLFETALRIFLSVSLCC